VTRADLGPTPGWRSMLPRWPVRFQGDHRPRLPEPLDKFCGVAFVVPPGAHCPQAVDGSVVLSTDLNQPISTGYGKSKGRAHNDE
jgi:hypothetical protein